MTRGALRLWLRAGGDSLVDLVRATAAAAARLLEKVG